MIAHPFLGRFLQKKMPRQLTPGQKILRTISAILF